MITASYAMTMHFLMGGRFSLGLGRGVDVVFDAFGLPANPSMPRSRLLYRLAISEHANQFLLKGALLFDLWFDVQHRQTFWALVHRICDRLRKHSKKFAL